MRRITVLIGLFALLAVAAPAHATVTYSYVVSNNNLTLAEGETATVTVFLKEVVNTSTGNTITSLVGAGLTAAGVTVTRQTGDGSAAFPTSSVIAKFTGPYSVNNGASVASFSQAISGLPNQPTFTNTQKFSYTDNGVTGSQTTEGNIITTLINVGQLTFTGGTTTSTFRFAANATDTSATARGGVSTGSYQIDPNRTTSGSAFTGVRETLFNNPYIITVNAQAIPEPSSLLLGGFAICGGVFGAWRKRQRQLIATESNA